jgi:hypothetical protein
MKHSLFDTLNIFEHWPLVTNRLPSRIFLTNADASLLVLAFPSPGTRSDSGDRIKVGRPVLGRRTVQESICWPTLPGVGEIECELDFRYMHCNMWK